MGKHRPSGLSELAKAATHRLGDAQALIAANRWQGAMCIAGYSVECLFKTKLMERFDCRNLEQLENELRKRRRIAIPRSIFTHELIWLAKLLDCIDRIQADKQMRRHFNLVNQWTPAWRYSAKPVTLVEASDFVHAVEKLLHWVRANV
jgi:hypothetical protein